MTGEVNDKKIRIVTQRFCSVLNDNAVIITTQTAKGKEQRCIYSDKCKAECKHKNKK